MIKKIKNKIIIKKNGNLLKFINNKKLKIKFGEIYFSEVLPNKFKGWKFHQNRNQFLTVVKGKVKFFFKNKNKKIQTITLSYSKITFSIFIPKKTCYSFKCLSKEKALIANIIDEVI